ncbi:MAG: hypothetical protein ACOCWI_02800 [Bacillota bacterium]
MRKLIYSIILMLLSLVVFTTAVAAWFTPSAQYIDNIVVTTGTLDAQAKLYRIEDFNNDGIYDVVDGENIYTPINEIEIIDMIPNDIYSYRLDVKNTGEAVGTLTVYFEDIQQELAEVLTYESVVKDNQDSVVEGAGVSKQIFSEENIFAQFEGLEPLAQDMQLSIYFYIKFETLDELKALNPTVFSEKDDLNEYQNMNFNIGKVIVYLEQAVQQT